jgi:hypothetical protein
MSTTLTPPAESSPATTTFTPDAPEARSEFMKTGVMPEPKADSTPAKETPAEGEKPEAKAAPGSESGKPQERRNTADTRLNELLDDLREAGLTPKALKSFKSDYQRTQAEPAKAATEKTDNPAGVDPKAPVKPKASDFEGKPWSEYEAAKDKYFEDLADYKAGKAIEADRSARQQEAQTKELQDRVTDAEKRYGTETRQTIQKTANAIFNDAKVPPAVKAMVNDSPVMVDLLYVMGSKAEDLTDFIDSAHSSGSVAIRKLVLLEQLVIAELGKAKAETPEQGADGKFVKAPEKKTTAAPPPPKEVDGTKAAPPDEIEAAIKRGDDRAAIDAMNRADIRRRKGH